MRDLLRLHWKRVEAVASALLERKRLSRAELRKLLIPDLVIKTIK